MLGKIDVQKLYPSLSHKSVSRRNFLQVSSLAGAGFMIGCDSKNTEAPVAKRAEVSIEEKQVFADTQINLFIRVATDNSVTVVVKHLDKGQGVTTGLPTIVAEEMDADWSQMKWEFAPADAKKYANLLFGVQGTGGSTSVANSWMQLRHAAAAARAMLVEAAAEQWQVAASEIEVKQGVLTHASGKQGRFGDFAAKAAAITPPTEPSLKNPEDFKLIGTRVARMDTPEKTDGSAIYTIDIKRPGMWVALVAHPPKFGGSVRSFDDTKARQVSGVNEVVQIPRGVAVLADSFWSAKKGRDALKIEWDFSVAETRSTEQLFNDFKTVLAQPGAVARTEGNLALLASATQKIEAEFEFPYLAHATMEPMDCVIELNESGCEVWTGSQLQTVDHGVVAAITQLPPEKVKIHTQFAGGSFGRRAVPDSDFVAEAAMIVKAIDGRAPVLLQWTREDDMSAGRYRPMSVHQMKAGLDENGNIVAWHHRLATQSFLQGTPFEGLIENGVDGSAVEGARGLPYAIPNIQVEQHLVDVGVPTLWWRSVGHTHNGFATEVFFDELAVAAGKDPYQFRRTLLQQHPRHLAVLDLAAKQAGWDRALPDGQGRGIAVHESFGSFVAQVAEVTLLDNGGVRIDRVVCAVDCGVAINPDVIKAQMEGGIAYGLSAAMREAVNLIDGEVQELNFHLYRPLRMHEMPEVEVHIVASGEAPTGVGEPGVPPSAPALVNAIYAAGGKRIRKLPIGQQLV